MTARYLLATFVLFLLCNILHAQDSLSIKDVQEIRYKAEALIRRELQDLLNNIAQPGFDSKETEEIIHNSYDGTINKIFESDKARIESDLNPKIHSSEPANDIDVLKYLKDFDILYSKSENFSVAFSSVKASQVKKANYLYVKVYFSSYFNNKYKGVEGETPYTLNNRVAEIKMTFSNQKWTPYIVRIGFFEAADTLNDVINDMAIKKEPGQQNGAAIDSATAVSIDAEIEAKKKKQLIDEENTEAQKFNNLINSGDKALGENNFTDALNYYRQAKELMPYDPLPRSKISKANKLQLSASITKDQLFEQYVDNARLATRKREYEEAIKYYRSALDNKPTEKANLQAEIDALTRKVNFLTEMNLNYKAGNYKEAIKQYTAAIKKKKDSDYFLGRARSNVKMGEYSDAMSDFTTAYELDNENLAAIEGRADLHKLLGDAVIKSKKADEKKDHYIKALTGYTSYLTLSKKNLHIYEAMAELQILLYNNTDDAIKTLDAGLDADLKAKQLYIKKGLLQLQKKDFTNADISFTSALKIDSNDAFAYYNRGIAQLNLNNVTYASVYFQNARRKGLDSANRANIVTYANAFYQHAENSYKNNAPDSAMNMINNAIDVDPSNSIYFFARGEYYSAQQHYLNAIDSYDKAIQLNKNYTDAYYKRGVSYNYIGKYSTAIENFNKANAQAYPQLYLVQKGIGEAFLALKEYSEASQNFEKAIKTADALKNDPPANTMAEIYNCLGIAYYYQQMSEKAIEAGKTAIRKNNAYADAYFHLGLAYYAGNKPEDAIENISKALNIDNKKVAWRYQLAVIQQSNNEFANAINNYTEVIEADTAHKISNALYNRGYAYYQSENYNAALADYIKYSASGVDSSFNNFNAELGNVYLHLGNYDSAVACYKNILAKDPSNGSAMYGIASCYFLQNKTDDALQWFEKSFQTKTINSGDVKKDKLIAGIKNEKTFKALMKKYF
ncbi:MAG: tetratricopeptide repeat protein [Agriterribacter sp.]